MNIVQDYFSVDNGVIVSNARYVNINNIIQYPLLCIFI